MITELLKVVVAVVSLAKDMIILSEEEFYPKDPEDRKILLKGIEASLATFTVPLAVTCFARAFLS